MFIRRHLNIEHWEIHWKPLPQKKGIMSPEIRKPSKQKLRVPETLMARVAKIGVVLLLLAQGLAADDWPGPRVMNVFSEDGARFVRVTPGESLGDSVGFAGAKQGAYAQALFYERQADR